MFEVTGTASSAADAPVTSPSVSGAVPVVRHRKIAILGFADTVKDAPWADVSWELWAMNGFWRAAKPDHGIDVPEDRYSLWFDTHTLEFTRAYGKEAGFNDAQERWLEQPHPFPILMLEDYPQFPSVEAYPTDMVIQKLGRDYFTSSVAYALALALTLDDVAEVGLWGVDLVSKQEYADQRPCAEYWLGRAHGLGIKTTLHERSALLRQRHRYGLEIKNPLLDDLRAALLNQQEQLEKATAGWLVKMDQLRAQAATDDGALQLTKALLGRLEIYERGGRI